MGTLPWLPEWVQCNQKGLNKRNSGGAKGEGDEVTEAEIGVKHFEEG